MLDTPIRVSETLSRSVANDAGLAVVCVLVERTYFHGATVLLNSLIRNGFSGELVIGYRGALPPLIADLRGETDGVPRIVAPGVSVRFLPVDSTWHLTNLKASFMQRVFEEIRPDLGTMFYFDADLLLRCGWQHFERWVKHGVVLALDMSETFMPPQHVFRREWEALAARCGLTNIRPATGYVNGGCIGVSAKHFEFIRVWARLMRQLEADGHDMTKVTVTGGMPEFAKMDQDVLNATVMATDVPLALLGQEAMDIFPSSVIMTHYMFHAKPWLRDYITDALKGFPPERNEFVFWDLANNPIPSFTPAELRAKRRRMKLARLIGLLRRRGGIRE
jgi:hypothetical protein